MSGYSSGAQILIKAEIARAGIYEALINFPGENMHLKTNKA